MADPTVPEEWRSVAEFPDYAVSNLGRVRRETNGKGRARAGYILKPAKHPDGHLHVTLCDGRRRCVDIHILVLEAFVGPRPALFNQDDLIALRTQYGVHELLPGLTGWAQVNGRDEIPISDKVRLDVQYLERQSVLFDIRILWLTFVSVIRRDGVTH